MNNFVREFFEDQPELLRRYERNEARYILQLPKNYDTISIDFGIDKNMILPMQRKTHRFTKRLSQRCLITLRRNTMFSRMAGYQAFRTGIKATAIFLLGEKQTVSNGIKQDGSMAWMQHRPQMRIRPLFADTGILRMAIANTNTRGPSLEKMRTSLPIMVPELLP